MANEDEQGAAVKAGEVIRLQCRVLGARPAPAILWKIDDKQLFNLEQNVSVRKFKIIPITYLYCIV